MKTLKVPTSAKELEKLLNSQLEKVKGGTVQDAQKFEDSCISCMPCCTRCNNGGY